MTFNTKSFETERFEAEIELLRSQLAEAQAEYRQAEASCEVLRAELAHASRLATVGALASGITHEINQPLSAAANWAAVASREIREQFGANAPEAILALDRIASAIKHVGQIVQRVKDFSRKDDLQLTMISLAEVIEEVRAMVEYSCRKNDIRLDIEVNRSTPRVFADRVQVQQILLNLIQNAIEAVENSDSQFRRVNVQSQVQDDMLEVAVKDAGCGVPPLSATGYSSLFSQLRRKG